MNEDCPLVHVLEPTVLLGAIKAMAAAIDSRSHYTRNHSVRVAGLCHIIGDELGLDKPQMATLLLAAHVHDIGKIGGANETILKKTGALTDTEWSHVLKHPAEGADLLKDVEGLEEVSLVVRHHHERPDGLGYPDHLKGEAIPYLSRVLATADAFEAMTSQRPYRKAITFEEALKELHTCSGKQFDPEIAAAAITAIKKHEARKKAA